jgi:hypothetical protein
LTQYARIPHMHKVEKAATIDEVEALAASYAPSVAKAIIYALEHSIEEIDLDALASALASGNLQKVLDMLKLQLQPVADALTNVAWAGGTYASEHMPINRMEWHFNRLNPVLIQWLQEYTLGLIRQVSNSTVAAVRAQLIAGMQAGIGPRAQATNIKSIIGLTDRQAQAVLNFRKELEGFHDKRTAGGYKLGAKIDRRNGAQIFRQGEGGNPLDGITERRLRDFRYDKMLARSMEQKKALTPEQIDKMVNAYARKYRKYRAETIARTESMRALNMGIQEGWRQAVNDGKIVEDLVRRFWKVASDERTCPVCKPIPKLNLGGVKLGMPFITSEGAVFLPPMHPDCRCHVFIRALEPFEVK